MVGKSNKRRAPKQRGSPTQEVSPRGESPRQSGSSVQEDSDDRVLPTSPQAGNEVVLGNMHVSPNDQSLDYQVNNNDSPEVLAEVIAAPEVLANEDRASNPPLVNDPEEKLHSTTASNSKTSMANSSGHPNDAGKKAAGTEASSSSDESSSSDDSSDDSSNESEDGEGSAPTQARGKNLRLQSRFGQGKQTQRVLQTSDDSSEDLSNDCSDDARSATTSACGKDLAFQSRLGQGKQLRPVLPTAKNRSTKSSPREVSQCVYFDAFTCYACHQLPENIDEILAVVKSVTTNVTSQRSGSTKCMS